MNIKNLSVKIIFASLFAVIISCSSGETDDTSPNNDIENNSLTSDDCQKTNCSNYNSQAEAQIAFDLDPECRKNLDHDGDGVACEEPDNNVTPRPTTSCPTTANCGCSGKNKTPCQNDPCCKWVVGEGCECR